MSTYIEECIKLIEHDLCDEFREFDHTIVPTHPDRIVNGWPISLWAQSTTVEKIINLRLPSIIRFLRTLAQSGVGAPEEFEGVMYRFTSMLPRA